MLLLAACAHSPPPAPEPVSSVPRGAEIHWYTLEGRDRIDLIESCLKNCPRDEQGTAVASLTTWELRWGWTRAPYDPCAVASASVDALASVALPRWEPPPDADPALVAEWGGWLARLERHEQGHVDLLHAFAESAELQLPASPCDRVEEAGSRLVAGLRAAQSDYDRLTSSGHTQGASFWTRPGVATR